MDRAPARGRRPCAVLYAPWRGLREQSWFGALFFFRQRGFAMHDQFTSQSHQGSASTNPTPATPPIPIYAVVGFAVAIATFVGGLWWTSGPLESPAPPPSPSVNSQLVLAPPPPPKLEIPSQYRVLAEILSLGMASQPEKFQQTTNNGQRAAWHEALDALQGITTEDLEIRNTAARAHEALSAFIQYSDALASLPVPMPASQRFLESFLSGAVAGYTGDPGIVMGYIGQATESDVKAAAKQQEMAIAICRAERQFDAIQQSLPRIASRFAAPPSPADERFTVDLNDTWGEHTSEKWFCIHNGGSDLHDCTLQVQLTGRDGQIRRNVHFLNHWPANTWMYAQYKVGFALPDGTQADSQSVAAIRAADLSLWSPEYSTQFHHDYQGAERDRDVQKYCEPLELIGTFIPFHAGILRDTEAGAEFILKGVKSLPPGTVTLTFRGPNQRRSWSWNQTGWSEGEKQSFYTPKGELKFIPQEVKVRLTFPDTAAECTRTLKF